MSVNRSPRTRDYRPLTPSGVDQMVRNYGKEAGIAQRVYPHLFRHSYITHMMRKGVNVEVIRRIVGHSTAALISSVYGHLVSDDLWDAQARVWEMEQRGTA